MPNSSRQIDVAFLQSFSDAWNRHDVDALMTFMTDDCVFETAAGPDVCGARHVGREAVRKAFEAAWLVFPDAQWADGSHFVCGDRGVSEWTFKVNCRSKRHFCQHAFKCGVPKTGGDHELLFGGSAGKGQGTRRAFRIGCGKIR